MAERKTATLTDYQGDYRPVAVSQWGLIAAGTGGNVHGFYSNGIIPVNAVNSSVLAFRLDPADLPTISGRTKRLRIRGSVITNAVAPGVDFRFIVAPVATWGGASGAYPTVASISGTWTMGTPWITAPVAGGPTSAVTAEIDYPAAGWYIMAVNNSGTTATGSMVTATMTREVRYS